MKYYIMAAACFFALWNCQPAHAADLANTLIYAGENETTINPLLNNHQELPTIIFSGLLKYDAKGMPVPDLAQSMNYDAATRTYTFTLRQGVTWHDGTPFTAADVVFTYEALTRNSTLASSVTSNYQDIALVTAPTPYTVLFSLSQTNAAMPGNFTIGILPRHLFEGRDINTAPANQKPVGTGRYKLESWDTAGGMVTLVRNQKYYDKIPNIERIIYKTVAVESTKALMLQAGEAHLAWLNARYAESFRGKAGFKNVDFKTADYRSVSMDFNSEFWKHNADSIGVLNYAVDKNALVQSVLDGKGVPAFSPLQFNPFGGNSAADMSSYNLEKFAATMATLGWKKGKDGVYERNGQRFSFTIQVRDYEEERVDIAQVLARQLKKAGVEMKIALVTRFDWKAGYNGFLAGFAVEFDPDGIYKDFVTGASDNTMGYSNSQVDELLKQGRAVENPEARKTIYRQFEEVYANNPGQLLLTYLDGNYVSTDTLKGLDTSRVLGHHAVGVMWNIENWTLGK